MMRRWMGALALAGLLMGCETMAPAPKVNTYQAPCAPILVSLEFQQWPVEWVYALPNGVHIIRFTQGQRSVEAAYAPNGELVGLDEDPDNPTAPVWVRDGDGCNWKQVYGGEQA